MVCMLKKVAAVFGMICFLITNAEAVNMVQKEDILNRRLSLAGLSDFPPFSYYDEDRGLYTLQGVFLQPLKEAFASYSFKFVPYSLTKEQYENPALFLIAAKSGEINVFIGAMSDTKLFSGLELIYPASVSNPIHILTTAEGSDKIKSTADLRNLKGVVCTQEYFSDFVLRKLKDFNIEYVATPLDAYEKLFTAEVDYMIGSSYFNRLMASRYGLNHYISYSKNPIFIILLFIAISRMTPVWEEYAKVFRTELAKPSFGLAVKREILDFITREEEKYDGIVPPTFAKQTIETQAEQSDLPETAETENTTSATAGHIIEKEVKETTFDEVLEGI